MSKSTLMSGATAAEIRNALDPDVLGFAFSPHRPSNRKRCGAIRQALRSVPLGLDLDAGVYSPRLVANGSGQWEGTLRELLADAQNHNGDRVDSVTDAMTADGRVVSDDDDNDDDAGLETVAHLLSLGDLEDLCDDPNVWCSRVYGGAA